MNLFQNVFGGASSGSAGGKTLFDFTVKDDKGADVPLSKYQGKKAIVVVNVASKCGLTAQNYSEFAQLYSTYSSKGLEILGFPCNQFGSQEPGTNAEVQAFAKARGATYPIFGKIEVNGEGADPLYKFLKASQGGFLGDDIKWNFSKFLVNADGNVIKRFGPQESPLTLVKDIEALLKA